MLMLFYHSLRFKIILCLLIIGALSIGGFYYLQTTIYRHQLIRLLEGSSARYLSKVVKERLKHAMLTRDLDETKNIMKAVREEQEIYDVFLVNKRGEVVVDIEGTSRRRFSVSDPSCQICHRSESQDRPKSVLFTDSQGRQVIRNVSPILNEPVCHGCHDVGTRVIGMLITDFSLPMVEEQLGRELRQYAAYLGIFLFVVIGILSFGIDSLVLARLQRFTSAILQLSRGDFSQRIPDEGRDEIGELAVAFNNMATDLERYITERETMKEELLRAEKLASLGVLSAGAAHEINNPLANISLGLQMLMQEQVLEPSHHHSCQDLLKEVERIRGIVRGLTTFSKQIEVEKHEVPTQVMIQALQRAAEKARQSGAEVVEDFQLASSLVKGNPIELHQVFENIIENAVMAMSGGGTLTLQAREVDRDGAPWLVVRITDTGTGIPPEHLPRIFDPFFTTWGAHRAKGLGLSVALGIVEAHGGSIKAESEEGQGTTFVVQLPLEQSRESHT